MTAHFYTPAPGLIRIDGSVRLISENIESALGANCGDASSDLVKSRFPTNDFTYQKLFNRQDGLVISEPF